MTAEVGSSDVRWKTVPQTSSCNRRRFVTDSGSVTCHLTQVYTARHIPSQTCRYFIYLFR